jgi:hypothetical protein
MAKLIGNNPSQIPTNGDLGSMAFEDRTNYITKGASVHQPFRNLIINGDMSIAQRGTSTTGVTISGYKTVDRFNFGIDNAGTWTITQDTDVPTGQGFAKSTKLDCTTANGSLSADSLLLFQQKLEGQNLQYLKKGTSSAESLTLSFWVKSNKTGTYICQLRDIDNSRSISQSYTILSASTWEKKILTFVGDTTGAFDNDNGDSLRLLFFLVAGTTYTSGTLQTSWGTYTNANRAVGQVNLADSTANEWFITGVQLEAGTTASDFEFLPVDVNLQRCQRYYQITQEADGSSDIICSGAMYSATEFYGTLYLGATTMRATPSVSADTGTNAYNIVGNGSSADASSLTLNNIGINSSIPHCRLEAVGSNTNVGQGNGAWIRFGGSSSNQKIIAEAEL